MTQNKKPAGMSKTTRSKKKQPLAMGNDPQQPQEESKLMELAQSRAELEAAYRQYTDLYDFAPVGYFTLARNGTIHQVNLAGANLLGVDHNEATRLRLAAFIFRESQPTFKVFFEKLLSGEGKETCELTFEKRGNELIWARLEATCFEGGDISRAMLTDITGRKRMEQALQESENRFRMLLQDVSTIAVQGYAMDGTTQYWNTASEKLYGYSAQEAIGQNLLELIIPPEMRKDVWHAIHQMGETGEPIPAAELSLTRKDGSRVAVYSSHAIVSVPGRAPELFCLDVDLTERKRIASLVQARVRISEFAELHTFNELLQKMLDEAEALTGSQVGFAHFLKADQKTLQLQMWSTNTLKNFCTAESKGSHYSIDEAGVWAACVSTRAPLIHNDYANLPNRKGLPQGHTPVMRELVVPVLRNDLVVMIVGVGNKSADYDDNDVEILSQLANLAWDVVQRKQAEELLKESEWRNRIVSELTADYIFVVDVDPSGVLKLRWASDNMFRMTGRTVEDAATSDLWGSIIHPDYKDRFFGFVNQILSTAEAGELECRALYKHGGERWIHIFARPQVSEDNNITAIVGAIQDISERKLAEEVLRESEEKYRRLFDNAILGIFQSTPEGKAISVNNAFAHMFGYDSPEDAIKRIGNVSSDIFSDPNRRTEILRLMAENPGLRTFENLYRRKDGSTFFGSLNTMPIRDPDGSLIRIEGIIEDITERKQTEKALRESQQLFSLFMHHSPIYTFIKEVTPTESRVLQASENYLNMIGITSRDMTGKTMEELFPPEFAAKFTADDWSVISSGEVLRLDEDMNDRHYTTIKFPIIQGDKTLLAGYTIDITERVEAETALKESEFFVKGILNSLTAHIAVLDRQGQIIAVNESWRNFGHENDSHDSADYVGSNYLDACQAAIQQGDPIARQVDQGIRAVLDGSQSQFSIEYPCHAPTHQHWFIVTVLPMHKSNQGLVVLHQDITERKQAEEALHVSEERFRLLANNIPDIIYSLNEEGNIVTVNSSAFERYGYTEQDAKGNPFLGFVHPEDREIVIASFLKALEEQRKFTHGLQFRIVAENGISYWFELNSQARYDSQSQYVGEDGVLRDITERKRVEDSLRESEEKFRLLIEQSMDGVILIDEQGMIIEWNTAESKITGIPRANALGTAFWDIQHQIMTPERRIKMTPQYLRETYFESYLGRKTDYLEKPRDIEIVSLSGEHKFLQQTSFIVKTEKGQWMGSVIHDITERKQVEVELQYMKDGLEKANRELQTALAREQQLAHTDALTGINNRRHLFELAEHEFEIAVRYQQPLAVVMFDIDHFKDVNDTFGHAVGDKILQQVTQVACAELRSADVIGRYGGEEFVIILPMTNAKRAHSLAERIRVGVAEIREPTEKGDASVTLSIGIVELHHGTQTGSIENMIRDADKVMYTAKQAGRNQTKIGVY